MDTLGCDLWAMVLCNHCSSWKYSLVLAWFYERQVIAALNHDPDILERFYILETPWQGGRGVKGSERYSDTSTVAIGFGRGEVDVSGYDVYLGDWVYYPTLTSSWLEYCVRAVI